MKPVERLEQATAPDGTVLTLYRHDGAYTIRVDGVELMSTRRHHSEDKLAELACAPLRDVADARVLIGGLGLGFTLASRARSTWPRRVGGRRRDRRRRDRVEQEVSTRAMRRWMTRASTCVTTTSPTCCGRIPGSSTRSFSTSTTAPTRSRPPETRACTTAPVFEWRKRALRPNGRLAYWSASDDRKFERMLRGAGFAVEVVKVRAHSTSGGFYTLFIAPNRLASGQSLME